MNKQKSELANNASNVIEEQRLKIEKYEGKLRALIQAYKSLLYEKNALEETVKAFSKADDDGETLSSDANSTGEGVSNKPGGCVLVVAEGESANTGDVSDIRKNSSAHFGETENRQNLDSLKRDDEVESVGSSDTEGTGSTKTIITAGTTAADQLKLSTLKKAISALTTEKARQEAAFTEDRKRLIHEKESLQNEIEKLKQDAVSSKEAFEKKEEELIATFKELQKQRDDEQGNYAAMLKEIQQKLTKERFQIEQLEKTVNSLNNELNSKNNEISRLSGVINQLNEKITNYEKKYGDAFNIEKLQSEFNHFKVKSGLDLEMGHKQLMETQTEITRIRNQNEEIIGTLERKIADLTSILSDCEKHKLDYVDKLETLQRRIFTLEQENLKINSVNFDDKNYQTVAKKCRELIHRLKSLDPNADVISVMGLSEFFNIDLLHEKCRKDYESLRNDFEQYKMQTKSFSNESVSTTVKEHSEVEILRQNVSNLEQKLRECQFNLSAQEKHYKNQLTLLKESHTRESQLLEQACQRRISEFENEVQKQRERTSQLLNEKEREISYLRSSLVEPPGFHADIDSTGFPAHAGASARCDSRNSYNSAEEMSAAFAENGDTSSVTPVDPSPSTALHLNRELARKDKEIANLRTDLRRIETQLVEVQHGVVTKELMHHEMQEKLKEEIRKCEARLARCSQTSQNMEYVKNVFVQFALSNDQTSKQHMLKAIAYALKLDYREMDELMKNYMKPAKK